MKARRDDCIIIASLAPQDPQVVHARPLDVFFADGLRGPALMAREAPRRLGGALGEALVVVRLAEEAVAVPVGALVHCVFGMELLPWCHGGGGLPRVGVCAHSQGPGRCARRCARNFSLPNYFSRFAPLWSKL